MNLFDFIEKHPALTIFIVLMIYYTVVDGIKALYGKG